MKRIIPIFVLLFILIPATNAFALTYPIPPLPDLPRSSWDVGSSVSFNITIQDGVDEASFNLRIAVIGSEVETNTTLYNVEFDFTDITLAPRWQEEISRTYGEAIGTVRFTMLIPYYDLVKTVTDPSQTYFDFSAPGFIRSIIFQFNNQAPYDVDPSLLGGFIFPLWASSFLGEDLPGDFVTSRNLGIQLVEDPQVYTTENSQSEITVGAGTYSGSLYAYTGTSETSDSGTVFYSSGIPILPIVMSSMTWVSDTGPGHTEIELVGVVSSGAATQITGEPIPLDIQTLMFSGMP